jgi:nucleoside-diphosphate-sugar epimerase
MNVLVTGHDGYLGAVMVPMLQAAGHRVKGLDTGLYKGCSLGPAPDPVPALRLDLRDVGPEHVHGFEAVIHLAGISNDPVGNLDPGLTYAVNHAATVQLARAAREAGVRRFIFSSSCSLYGAAGSDRLQTEDASFDPVTPYGASKFMAERDLGLLATEGFSPTFLRNATVYGLSPRLRVDLVVNNLVAHAHAHRSILIESDGTPIRPLVHVRDVARVFLSVLEAPIEVVHVQAFNVARTEENYEIREIAEIVQRVMPGTSIEYAKDGGPDRRCYRVDGSKLARTFPELDLKWDVRRGVEELITGYRRHGLSAADVDGPRFTRLGRVRRLIDDALLDSDLRWIDSPERSGEERTSAALQRPWGDQGTTS